MLLRTTRGLATKFSRTAALEGNLARREASAKLDGGAPTKEEKLECSLEAMDHMALKINDIVRRLR